MNTILSVSNLSKSCGEKKVLADFNLSLCSGEVVGILGENGAGKSTAIECMVGTKTPDAGVVTILGMHPVKDRKAVTQKIGVQFQHTGYQDRIKVREICEMTVALYDESADWKNLLRRFNLEEFANRFVNDLSGGERQRLTVALALIPHPQLVFLDELTTALDPRMRKDVLKYIGQLKKDGLSIVLVSHFMDEVQQLCDKVIILSQGKTVAHGTIDEITRISGKDNLEDAYLHLSEETEILEVSEEL